MHGASAEHGAATETDPVCGMHVDPATATDACEHEGRRYVFCCDGCLATFRADPKKALANPPPSFDVGAPAHGAAHGAEPAGPAPAGAKYTCPMHPEVVQEGPGTCPKCGMALERAAPPARGEEEREDPELVDMRRRLVVSGPLAAIVVVIAMGGMFGVGEALGAATPWVELALTAPVVLWGGYPFFARGAQSVRARSLNMFTLIALGTGAAFLYSIAATVLPGFFPPAAHGHGPDVYFEAAASIVVLVLVGQVLELRARARTGAALRALLGLAPKTALRVEPGGAEREIDLDAVGVGDLLRVRPGERVPVDGVVVEGETSIDESMVTGEPLPAAKGPGDAVTSGTTNGTGGFVMRAERVGEGTLLARIVELVARAQRTRAPIQRLADRASAVFVPVVLAVALVAFAAWLALGPAPRLPHAVMSAAAGLLIACPCALGLATPMGILVGTARGASAGVLVRDAEALERLEKVDTLVVDKTGTLTEGKPVVASVFAIGALAEDRLLALAASVERGSEHPLAGAIVAAAEARGLALSQASGLASAPGRGVAARVGAQSVALGTARYLEGLGAKVPAELAARVATEREAGRTAVLVAVDGEAVGGVSVADPVRATAKAALEALRAEGLRVVMLTGDARATAEAVARALGIDEVHAEVLPDGKAEVVAALQKEGRVVAMAGDGVNDAPALARADVGIAMGTGADVALESAPMTLVRPDLAALVRARRLSRATMRNIRQNLALAFVYNAAAVPLAAGALYPLTGLLLNPMIASAAMSLSSVSVVSNALRLRRAAL
ncbi:MAG TPA: heavy metal translocating P-type ATPase [Minicystis sp.]|nr:heavy metal translocating P-type ATPase [Minicystis sp.]